MTVLHPRVSVFPALIMFSSLCFILRNESLPCSPFPGHQRAGESAHGTIHLNFSALTRPGESLLRGPWGSRCASRCDTRAAPLHWLLARPCPARSLCSHLQNSVYSSLCRTADVPVCWREALVSLDLTDIEAIQSCEHIFWKFKWSAEEKTKKRPSKKPLLSVGRRTRLSPQEGT